MIHALVTFSLLHVCRRPWFAWCRRMYTWWLGAVVGVLVLLAWAKNPAWPAWDIPFYLYHEGAQRFFAIFMWQQAILLLLITPAIAAGAITDEKSRGTLQYLLTTPLTAWEIILGKWLTHVRQIGVLALSALPLLVFLGVWLSAGPWPVLSLFIGGLLQLAGVAAASLLAAVWCRRTTEAVFGLYLITAVVLALAGGLGYGDFFHPYYLFNSCWPDVKWPELLAKLGWWVACWGGVCLVCLGLAAWRLRPTHAKQMTGGNKHRRYLFTGRPSVADRPLRWKERYVGDHALGASRLPLPQWLLQPAIGILTLLLGWVLLLVWDYAFFVLGPVVLILCSALGTVRGSGTISGEREKQTWDSLLTTPLGSRPLVRGKFWGIMDWFFPILLAHGVAAFLISLFVGLGALLWTVAWWGLTWMVLYYSIASGLESSVRSSNTWRSLLVALAANAKATFLRLIFMGLLLGNMIALSLIDSLPYALSPEVILGLQGLGICLMTSIGLFGEAERCLEKTEDWIARKDRVWQEHPDYQGADVSVSGTNNS